MTALPSPVNRPTMPTVHRVTPYATSGRGTIGFTAVCPDCQWTRTWMAEDKANVAPALDWAQTAAAAHKDGHQTAYTLRVLQAGVSYTSNPTGETMLARLTSEGLKVVPT